MVCPDNCSEDRKRLGESVKVLFAKCDKLDDLSVKPFLRSLLITIIGVLFICFAYLVVETKNYATKSELKEMKEEMTAAQDKIANKISIGFSEVLRKLDK